MPNRLSKELSPYLLQHANNPVDWFPWGDEALSRAKAENKPILLSIGYSACHWCHVMEHESFEDEKTAALMNEHFVSIKVDREERPDLDQIYQLVVQLMGRSGGWPLTVFLTPTQKPFFGGTYFPPIEKYGMPSFKTLLTTIAEAWKTEHDDLVHQGEELTRAIEKTTAMNDHAEITEDSLRKAVLDILHRGDDANGGFGVRPKFPNPMALEVLLADSHARENPDAKKHVALTLDKMRAGGVYDQLGGGFHRYSTDEKWLVPHFEKMLYDNALLLRAYADGFSVFQNPKYKTTCEEIASYVLAEMRDKNGAFFSTEDADSEGSEGKYFVWTEGEARALLMHDPVARDVALAHFGITEAGNFEHTMTTVLSEARPLSDVAKALKLSLDEAQNALTRAKRIMLDARKPRVRPFRDEKILTSWNALMIGALAHAGAALGNKTMLDGATRALAALRKSLATEHEGSLMISRLMKGENVKGTGFLDDYAFLADASIDVYEATSEPPHAAFAKQICDAMLEKFYDEARGFFFTAKSDEKNANDALIVRAQDAYDSAIPSGTAVACRVLLRLGALKDERYEKIAERELARLAPTAFRAPLGVCHSLTSMMRLVRGSVDVVLVGARDDARTRALAKLVHNAYIPHRTIAWLDPDDAESRDITARISEGKNKVNQPCAYVCRGRACSLPVTDVAELAKLLAE